MNAYVVVQGPLEETILKALLPKELLKVSPLNSSRSILKALLPKELLKELLRDRRTPIAGLLALLARSDPQEALAQLLGSQDREQNIHHVLDRLDEQDVEALRLTGPLHDLIAFLTEVVGAQPQPSSR
jgi:hypothetical protein